MGNSERLRAVGDNKTEKLFYLAATDAGAQLTPHPSIRAPYPVADQYGVVRKVVTNPDFLLTFSQENRSMYVEVTKGAGQLPAKKAQQRVVDAAGVDNYIQLSGDQVQALIESPTPAQRKRLLFQYFGWA